jgi:hypothetical protein
MSDTMISKGDLSESLPQVPNLRVTGELGLQFSSKCKR